jgi:transcriptional regulator with XRE-family HTH domain
MTQEELATKLSLSQSALSRYEVGELQIDADELPRFAQALGVNASAFYEEVERSWMPTPGEVLYWVERYFQGLHGSDSRSPDGSPLDGNHEGAMPRVDPDGLGLYELGLRPAALLAN